MKEIYLSSRNKNEYPIYLTKEQLEAIPVILSMAMVYSWDLYDKREDDKFYNVHKENIELIKNYHDKGYQGVLAVGGFIEGKVKNVLDNLKLDDILKPYMNNCIKKDAIMFYSKDIEIKNHIGYFNDEYIDFITMFYTENEKYEVIPIDNKFTIPYVKDGTVKAFYKKLVKDIYYCEIRAEDYPKSR